MGNSILLDTSSLRTPISTALHSPVPVAPPSTPCNLAGVAAVNAAATQTLRNGLDLAWKCMEAEDEDSSPVNGSATTHSIDLGITKRSIDLDKIDKQMERPAAPSVS